jgi:hypothetical protein
MKQLAEDNTVHQMVNLQCSAHMLSLLMKDLAKRFEWVGLALTQVIYISSSINSSEKLRFVFQQQCLLDGDACCTVPVHCDTRFGSQYLVAVAVERRMKTLAAMVGSAAFLKLIDEGNETAVKLHQMLLGEYGRPDSLAKGCQ